MLSNVQIFTTTFCVISPHNIGFLTNVQVLELEQCGVQLKQCQLVRYNEKSGTLGKPFDEPKVSADCCVCVFVCVCDM